MLKDLMALLGEQPTIILDGSALNNPFAEKWTGLVFERNNLAHTDIKACEEQFEYQMASLTELDYLLTNNTVIIPAEIREELRNKMIYLRKRRQYVETMSKFTGKDELIDQMDQFRQALERIRDKSFNRDPRENKFIYPQIPRIQKDENYLRLVENATKRWRAIIDSFGHAKQKVHSSNGEGHLGTIAYLIQTNSPTAILANTRTIEGLMLESFEKATLIDLTPPPVYARKIEYKSKDVVVFYPHVTLYGHGPQKVERTTFAQAHPVAFDRRGSLNLIDRQI